MPIDWEAEELGKIFRVALGHLVREHGGRIELALDELEETLNQTCGLLLDLDQQRGSVIFTIAEKTDASDSTIPLEVAVCPECRWPLLMNFDLCANDLKGKCSNPAAETTHTFDPQTWMAALSRIAAWMEEVIKTDKIQ